MAEDQKKTPINQNDSSLYWKYVEERDSIRSAQGVVFGSATGFLITQFASRFLLDDCSDLLSSQKVYMNLYFVLELFICVSLAFFCHKAVTDI